MGYRRNRRLDLTFNDEEWEGLEVAALRPSLGTYLEMRKLEPDATGTDRAVSLFAPCLAEWNLEDDDGNPVPTTEEALREQDPDLVVAILDAWINAVEGVGTEGGAVPAPLATPSNDGEPLVEASIPMEPLSESRAS